MIEITKTLNHVDMNIMEFLHKAVKIDKYNRIANAITQQGLWGDETALTHYLGKRDDESIVHYLQIDFKEHDSLYIVVEQDELQ